MTTTATDPLVEAIVRLLTRHHNGCDHPVQPAPWMRNAATEIATAINRTTIYGRLNADQLQRLIAADIDRRNQP